MQHVLMHPLIPCFCRREGEKRELTEVGGTWEGLAREVFVCRHAECPSAELGNSRCTPALGTALLLPRVLGDRAAT